MQHHKYSLTELENMISYERTVYVLLLTQYLKEKLEEEQKKKNRQ
jgi:hypothetical protein